MSFASSSRGLAANRTRNGVYLRADRSVDYGTVVQLLAIMNANGVTNIGSDDRARGRFGSMSAVRAPRLAGGFAASVVFHTAVVGALAFLLRAGRACARHRRSTVCRSSPRPPGERVAGVVQSRRHRVAPKPLPPRSPARARELPVAYAAKRRADETKRRCQPLPRATPRTKAPPTRSRRDASAAAGGPTGGQGRRRRERRHAGNRISISRRTPTTSFRSSCDGSDPCKAA